MRMLALHARRTAGTAELRVLLTELSSGGRDERRAALHMAMAARDLAYVERVLTGPDLELRRAALRAVRTLPVSDEAAAGVLDDAPSGLRAALYRTLRHARRTALADRLLPQVRSRWGDREAAALLPACTQGTTARLLPELVHAVTSWRALGSRHPRALLDQAARETADDRFPWEWVRTRRWGLVAAALREPELALSVLEGGGLGRFTEGFPAKVITALYECDAGRTARLLRRGRRRRGSLPARVLGHLRSLPDEELLEFLPSDPYALRDHLRRFPPGRRAEVLDLVLERAGGPGPGLRGIALLDLLPPERAAVEARRMLDWHGSVWHSARRRLDDPGIPLRLTAFLPDGEATVPLTEAARGGDPRLRGLARGLLLDRAARARDRGRVRVLVAELSARVRNERDPLRGELVTGLLKLPVSLLDDGYVPALDELCAAIVDARDSSEETRRVLHALAGRVLAHHSSAGLTGWALDVYERLVARYGWEGIYPAPHHTRLDLVLPKGLERELLARLRPHLRAAREREDPGLALVLGWTLGRRAHLLEELQDDLRAAILRSPGKPVLDAAELWLARPAGREERAVSLLADDPSAIALPGVWSVVSRRRTDLLLAALDGDREGGASRGDRVPEVTAGSAGRWTAAQRERVRERLTAAVRDGALPPDARLSALASLGRLPGGLGDLVPYAEQDETVLAEAALDAMAASDRPAEALRILLLHARGPASRVAVAAMARCCRSVRPSVLGPLLDEVLTGPAAKVTARKRAAALLERHRPPGAAEALLRAWDDTALHRDVRIAVAVALRWMPETPGALDRLFAAAGPYAGEPMLRTLFQARPGEYAPRHRPRYAELVRGLLDAADGPGVRFRGVKAFAAWTRWYEGGFDEILESVADPGNDAGTAGLSTLRMLVRTGALRDPAVDVLARLVEAGQEPVARARAAGLAGTISQLPGVYDPETWRLDLARRAVRVLAPHPLYRAQAADIVVTMLFVPRTGPSDPDEITAGFGELAALLVDRPVLAARLAESLGQRLGRWDPPRYLPAARALAAGDGVAAQLLAVRLVQAGGRATEWTGGWRELLDGLRRSDHVEIRQEAWDVEDLTGGG
ncbi:hypothetical protein [Actinomadura xylanilytica]|uniref:hypothetical protein n=1 Tax=Actinomadura xylanilytica TaxID=887459 RepID=UPI00255B2B45|nr:hypothetical protein [Actinomadura xylanilytica]MDL4776484.1 hypothetical protein [Actinomadura xylanilytica]